MARVPARNSSRHMTRQHWRAVFVVIASTQIVLAVVTAGLVYVGWTHLDHNIQAGPPIQHLVPAKTSGDAGPTTPLNILVLGTDTRSGSGDAIDSEAGCGCSDTTLLVHVSADRKSAYSISIPRDAMVKPVACTKGDTYVDPQGTDTGLVEWNSAFHDGGPECTAQQVEGDFGVRVDDYIVVDFSGFTDMVDRLGGVDVCVPFELYDPRFDHVDIEPGPSVHLDGAHALKYFRLRHGYQPGTMAYTLDGTDTGRIKRQQYFISQMLGKVLSTDTLTRPDKLYRFADALTKAITPSDGLDSVTKLVDLARQFGHIDLSHIKFITLPSQNYPPTSPFANRVQVLPAAVTMMKKVENDASLRAVKGSPKVGAKHASQQTKAANAAVGLCA